MVKSANKDSYCPKCGRPVPAQGSYCPSCGTRIFKDSKGKETTDPYLGQVIDGTFEVESILGTGSMGIVYKARHKALDCYVALKVLRHDYISDRVVLARFQREAQAASLLSHPNVIRILHYGKTSLNAPYIAMECLEGTELAVLISREFPINPLRICSIILQTAKALSAAHAANIIHRDLKPANIVVSSKTGQELVKVLDFGIAKLTDVEGKGLTREGAICGTPAFMSPEQVLGKPVTPASDLFSLGSILYYMLTCKLPFQGTTMPDMANSILTTEPPEPSKVRLDNYVDPQLEAICLKALKKDPKERYQSALEIIADLEAAMRSLSTNKPHKKQKIIVGEIDDSIDLSAETGFISPDDAEGLKLLDKYKSQYLDDEEDEEGGTKVEMRAMSGDDFFDTAPGVTEAPGLRSAVNAVGQAISGMFNDESPRTLAAGDKTIIRPSVSDDQPDELAMVEKQRRERKKLFLGIIVIIATLCILCLIFLAIISSVSTPENTRTPSENTAEIQNTGSDDSSKKVEDGPKEPAVEDEKAQKEELSLTQLMRYRDIVSDKSSENTATAVAIGIKDASNEDTGESENESDTGESENESDTESDSEDTAPEPEAAPEPENRQEAPAPTSHRHQKSRSRNTKSVSSSPKADTAKPQTKTKPPILKPDTSASAGSKTASAAEKKMKQAQSLEASGDKIKACDIYKSLAKDSSLSQSERLKVQNKLRACSRVSTTRISI